MKLEELVLAELNSMNLHGVKVIGLLCDAKTVQIRFEIGSVTIDCTTINEAIFQINALTHEGKVFVADEATLSQCNDWVKYICSMIHPIINKYCDQLIAPTHVKEVGASEEVEEVGASQEVSLNEALKMLQEARQEIEQLKTSNQSQVVSQQSMPYTPPEKPPVSTRKKIFSVIGSIIFYLALIATVLGVAFFGLQEPAAPPRVLAGHSMMTVLSRSMEPTLPVRSLVVARTVDPNQLEIDDVITYVRQNNTTVTHRIIEIIENYQNTGERGFRLQGDNSNSVPDRSVVRAENVIGEIIFSNLFLGLVVFFVQRNIVLIVIFIVLGIALFYVIKKFFWNGPQAPDNDSPVDIAEATDSGSQASIDGDDGVASLRGQVEDDANDVEKKKKLKRYIQLTVAVVLLAVFGYSAYRVLGYRMMYQRIEAAGAGIRDDYTQVVVDQESARTFLSVDWDGLLARNTDVVAWVHVPGTVINYPVLAGATNETYLRTDIDRLPSEAGSVFLEENNESTFLDLNTIIYGHNMLNGSKFADIDALVRGELTPADVPYVYLYLPDGTVNIYRIVGGQLTDIFSLIYHLPVEDLEAFYELMLEDNVMDVAFDRGELARVLTLSTCAEVGGSPVRSVVFAVLVDEVIIGRIN